MPSAGVWMVAKNYNKKLPQHFPLSKCGHVNHEAKYNVRS